MKMPTRKDDQKRCLSNVEKNDSKFVILRFHSFCSLSFFFAINESNADLIESEKTSSIFFFYFLFHFCSLGWTSNPSKLNKWIIPACSPNLYLNFFLQMRKWSEGRGWRQQLRIEIKNLCVESFGAFLTILASLSWTGDDDQKKIFY